MKKIKLYFLIMVCILFTGCSNNKYQKDESYETDIVGTYSTKGFDVETNELVLQYEYKINSNETFEYYGFFSDTECYQYGNFIVKSVGNEISEINFNIENTEIKPNEDSANLNSIKMSSNIYKYRNMLGYIIEVKDFPTSETFNYTIPDNFGGGMVFEKDGNYHSCTNINDCHDNYDECAGAKYIEKDNVIYFNIKSSVSDDYWQIADYIVDDYLFFPSVYKMQE